MIDIPDKKLEAKVKQIEEYALTTIQRIANLENTLTNVKMFDAEVYRHCQNVCRLSVIIGLGYNFNLDDLINLAIGGILHDVGKLYLNREILYKPDRLDEDERIFVEAHVNLGYKILKKPQVNDIVLDICKYHHEKLNGLGYPDGLSASDISIFVQIVTVADIFDALTSERCYKEALPVEQAIFILKADSGLNQVAVSILEHSIK